MKKFSDAKIPLATESDLENDKLLDTAMAAKYLCLHPGTLRNMRCHGEGPKLVCIGTKKLYRKKDLDKWVDQQVKDPSAA